MQERISKGGTLLQQLGFADDDRGNPRHDLAVAYCKARATQLGLFLLGNKLPWEWSLVPEQRVMRPDLRSPLSPSAFFVGFADGLLCGSWNMATSFGNTYAFVEVKISRVPAGDVVRQIEAYRTGIVGSWSPYTHAEVDLLVCDYDMSVAEVDMLACRNVRTLRLGAAFEAFAQAQAQAQIPEF